MLCHRLVGGERGTLQGILRGKFDQTELVQAVEPGCVPGDLVPGWVGWILLRAWFGCIWESLAFLEKEYTQEVLLLLHWSMRKRVENSRKDDLGKCRSGGDI